MRRLYGPSVLGLLALGGLAVFAASRPWARATVTAAGVPADPVEATGNDIVPLVAALGLVAAACGIGVLAAGPRLRRAIGVLAALAGLGIALAAGLADAGSALDRAVAQSPAFLGQNAPPDAASTLWPWLAVGCGLLVAAAGLIVVGGAGGWPTMGRRYEARPASPVAEPDDPWTILDAGHDPTVHLDSGDS